MRAQSPNILCLHEFDRFECRGTRNVCGSRTLNNRLRLAADMRLAADTCPSMTRIPRVWTIDGRVDVYEPSIDHDWTAKSTWCILLETGQMEGPGLALVTHKYSPKSTPISVICYSNRLKVVALWISMPINRGPYCPGQCPKGICM